MGIQNAKQHLSSLQDERVVYYRGERVKDVTTHAVLGIGARHASIDFELAEEPAFQELMTYIEPSTGERCSRYFKLPECAEDLLTRREMIETATREAAGLNAEIEKNQQAQRAAGHWGVPLMVFGGEAFYGQDRFDMLCWRLSESGLGKSN